MAATVRFERVTDSMHGGKAFSRGEVNRRLGHRDAMDSGAFLARLWARFGAPSVHDGGFEYHVRDRETGLGFSAYSGASGPSYGGDRKVLRPVVEAFERWLDEIEPVDCEWRYGDDIEYGGDAIAIGFADGRPFERSVDTRTRPETATSYPQCVAIAAEREGGYGPLAGWQQCLDAVMPEPPASFTWKRRRYDEHVGFTLDDDDEPVMLFIGRDGSPVNVPLSAIPFEAMPAIATLWLDAFERWKRERAPGA